MRIGKENRKREKEKGTEKERDRKKEGEDPNNFKTNTFFLNLMWIKPSLILIEERLSYYLKELYSIYRLLGKLISNSYWTSKLSNFYFDLKILLGIMWRFPTKVDCKWYLMAKFCCLILYSYYTRPIVSLHDINYFIFIVWDLTWMSINLHHLGLLLYKCLNYPYISDFMFGFYWKLIN